MEYKEKSLCRVRTVTTFITLSNEKSTWKEKIEKASAFCIKTSEALAVEGYTVQTIRIVTNAFGDYMDTSSLESAKNDLQFLNDIIKQLHNSKLRIRFAIGEAKSVQEIKLIPELIKEFGDLCNVCVNVGRDNSGVLNNDLINHCVEAVKHIAEITPRGEGNFNFTVNFNCKPLIPYFPASYHISNMEDQFVIGLETPDLLVNAVKNVNENKGKSNYSEKMTAYYKAMSTALQFHIDQIDAIIKEKCLNQGFVFAGYDSSAAPSKDCSSMVELYTQMGVEYFGAAGTVEISSLLTKVFKSIKNVNLVGFSGLMLALTEDKGLAQGSVSKDFDIRSLLTYSSVCGIGLDTVPIPGNTANHKIAALMRDTGTMAYRLNKPLTVRLFPVPNFEAGELTKFESSDLCNCSILAVP